MSGGQQIRQERQRAGLSVLALARRLNPDKPEHARRCINRWESGRTAPKRATLDQIADALEVPRDTFTTNGKVPA